MKENFHPISCTISLMKYISIIVFICILSFTHISNNRFYGKWRIQDAIDLKDSTTLEHLALRTMIKNNIMSQKIFIILDSDSIKMIKNNIITEQNKIYDFKIIKSDSAIFNFSNHTCSFNIEKNRIGKIIIDNRNVFFLEKN